MKRVVLAASLLLMPVSAAYARGPRVVHAYGWGMDLFGGGVTYDATAPWEAPRMPQDESPAHRAWNRHDWLHWLHRGYQGGESGYHGPFDFPR